MNSLSSFVGKLKFYLNLQGSSVVARDCKLDVNSEWCQNDVNCEKCSTNGCNIENVKFSWCLRCKSDLDGECGQISNLNEFIDRCDILPYPYSKRGCFTINQSILNKFQ